MAEENKLKLVESIIKSIVGIILPFILVWMLLSHNPTSLNININVKDIVTTEINCDCKRRTRRRLTAGGHYYFYVWGLEDKTSSNNAS